MKLLFTLFIAWISIGIAALILDWWNADYSVIAGPTEVHKEMQGEKFNKALRYHGVHDWEVRPHNGILVFYRDGQRCELFKYLETKNGI